MIRLTIAHRLFSILALGLAVALSPAQSVWAKSSSSAQTESKPKKTKTSNQAKKKTEKKASSKKTKQAKKQSSGIKHASLKESSIKAVQGTQSAIKLGNDFDPLDLNSSVALVADADSHEVIYAKNPHWVLPIASITKLMTVIVSLEASQDLDEVITISREDIDTYKNTSSRLQPGSQFTRRELMHLALMASENRAASALGRNYPGGLDACVSQMNRRAKQLGMINTSFVETTGLSASNRSSANDLARMVLHARRFKLIREYSTDPQTSIQTTKGTMNFRNTNRLVRKGEWDIALQKTGFINEAGRCLVMQAKVADRNLVIVLLDALGSAARFSDAERIRQFVANKHYH